MHALAIIVLFCGAVFPLALLSTLVAIHLPDRRSVTWAGRETLKKAVEFMRQWSIPEVQVLATLVALAKLGDMVNVAIGRAFWSYCAMTLCLLIANYGFDYSVAAPDAAPAETQPRRHAWSHLLRFRSRQTSAALALAAVVLLYPANFLPVLESETAGNNRIDTIFSGAMELGEKGLWVLTAIVLLASIVIPVLKLVGISILLYSTRGGRRPKNPRRTTKLYAALAFIGRWSMLDVFLAGLLAGLVRFGEVALARPMPAIIAFCAVVILTVLATEAFDPLQIWTDPENLNDP
jgi:paraquat-inducible protein A